MVGVSGVRGPGAAGTGVGRKAGPTGGFAVPETAGPAVAAVPASVSLTTMLSLQETGREDVRDRAARRHGRAILELLAALQHELLDGQGCASASFDRLSALAEAVPDASDPALQQVLRAVALRARIEVARRRS